MARDVWHQVTGEYPPKLGGVADYSWLVATRLAEAGREVHVWTAPHEGATPVVPGVTVHRIAGRWAPADLAAIDAALEPFPAPRRILVQYAPSAFGYKGMNLAFPRWLRRRRRAGDDVRLMIHEAAYPFLLRDKPTRWVLAAGHRLMLRDLFRASRWVYASVEDPADRLGHYAPRPAPPIAWLPIPSTVPEVDDPAGVADLRRRIAPRGERVLGTFATVHEGSHEPLVEALPAVLRGRADRVALLIGRSSEELKALVASRDPDVAERLVVTGRVDSPSLSRHLRCCDLMVQSYHDGISPRRSSVMACLAHGLPVLTTSGHNTGPLWRETGAVALVPFGDAAALAREADALLDDPERRSRLAAAGEAAYRRYFSLDLTVEALLRDAEAGAGRAVG